MSKRVCQEQKFFATAGVDPNVFDANLRDLAVTEKRVFVTGNLIGPTATQFNGEPVETFYGENDIFVASLNHCGTQRFFATAGGNIDDSGISIDADERRVVLTGTLQGPTAADFNGTDLDLTPNSFGFVAKLNHKGVQKYFKTGKGLSPNMLKLNNQNTFVVGGFESSTAGDFAGNVVTNIGSGDIFVAGLDKCGNQTFFKTAGSADEDNAIALAVTDRRVYVTGFVSGPTSTDFNGVSVPNNILGGPNAFVAGLNHEGDQKFFVTANSIGIDVGYSIDTFGGKVYVAGIVGGETATDFEGNLLNLGSGLKIFAAGLNKCGQQNFFTTAIVQEFDGNIISIISNEYGIYVSGLLLGPTATDFAGNALEISDTNNTVFLAGLDYCGRQRFFRTSTVSAPAYVSKQITSNENGVYLVAAFEDSATGIDFRGREIALEGGIAVAGFDHKGCQKFFVSGGSTYDDDTARNTETNIKVIGNRIFVSGNLSDLIGTQFNGQGTGFQGDMFVARIDDLCLAPRAPFRSKIPVF